MRALSKTCLSALLVGVMVAPAAPVCAATATSTIAVSATVLSFCTIAAAPLAFGNYSAAAVNATATLSVACTVGTTYNIGLDAGGGSGATTTMRKMSFNSSTLNYALYSDAARTVIWGNVVGTNTLAGTGSGLAQNLTVYGQIPANQLVSPGAYLDTVTATITY